MTDIWAAYVAAFALGAAHALEVDHMVAVSAFVGGNPRLLAAAGFGMRWGLGHGAVVLLAGGLLAWSGIRVPPSGSAWAELAVGMILVALGVWALRVARRLHVHPPSTHGDHAHLHAHPGGERGPHEHRHAAPGRRHRHLSTLIGAAHGLAGTAPVVALVPVTLISDMRLALGYLAVFGVGTVLAMGTYAVLAAVAIRGAGASARAARGIAVGTALASVGVGLWWIVRAIVSRS